MESGLTQEQVAEQLGIGNEAVSRVERSLVVPTVARLVELADIFGCNAADLLTGASTRSSGQGKYVGQLLARLSGSDRTMVIEIVERWLTASRWPAMLDLHRRRLGTAKSDRRRVRKAIDLLIAPVYALLNAVQS